MRRNRDCTRQGRRRPAAHVAADSSTWKESTRCDATRAALWNGEAHAWSARGVTAPDEVFVATVILRVRAGDPAAISNIARVLGAPYLKITRLRFADELPGQAGEFVEITNLGGGAQSLAGWSLRSPARGAHFALRSDLVLAPGQSCRFYTEGFPGRGGTLCHAVVPGLADLWPDDAGRVVLYYDALNLLGDDTRYSADPNSQPPPPNLQLERAGGS